MQAAVAQRKLRQRNSASRPLTHKGGERCGSTYVYYGDIVMVSLSTVALKGRG